MSAPNAIQDAIAAYLRTVPWFATPTAIGIFTQDEGDLEGKINSALGSLTGGLAIMVTCPEGSNSDQLSARVCLDSIIDVRCIEIPLICRATGGLNKTAYQAARRIASPSRSDNKGLHGWSSGVSGCGLLNVQRVASDSDPESGALTYSVTFGFKETLT